jgi:hypothetical protein
MIVVSPREPIPFETKIFYSTLLQHILKIIHALLTSLSTTLLLVSKQDFIKISRQ